MDNRYQFGPFTLDTAKLALSRDGSTINLRPKSFDTLRVLVERAGQVVSKDELVAIVWPDVIVNDDALAQCIRDIRQALGDDEHQLVRTVPKRGYILDVVIEPPSPAVLPGKKRGAFYVAIATVLLALAVSLWTLWSEPQGARQITVAVLPFATVGPDETHSWLGEGIAEDIMTELSRFTELGVIARNSSFRYSEVIDSPQAVGEILNADYLLQGSVRKYGDSVRVALQLVETDRGSNIWAERYDASYDELIVLPQRIVGAIASRLATKVRTDAASAAVQRPGSVDAFEATLIARHAYNQFSRDKTYEGLEAAEYAISIDPENALAWEYKARLLVQFYLQPYDERRGNPDILEEALDAARQAVHFDRGSSSALGILGDVYAWTGDYETALKFLHRAVELNPNDPSAQRLLADVQGRAGFHSESLIAWEESIRLDPIKVPLVHALIGRSHLMLGNYKQALNQTSECIELTPHMMPCHIFHAMAAKAADQDIAAAASVQRILTLAPGFTVNGWLNIVGYRDEGTIARLKELAISAGLPP